MLRRASEALVRGALGGRTGERPWEPLLAAARESAAAVGELAEERMRNERELLPSRERRRHERESQEDRRRRERRARSGTLDLGLELSELWLRDMLCLAEGAPELLLAVDRRAELEQDSDGRRREALMRALELVDDVRLSLQLNVSEELALEALAYRLEELLAG
jgi:DNA polymerase-3 subunit delta'